MNKILDLRFVIGCFFLLTGIILLAYSFLSSNSKIADPQNINRWCGGLFVLFGIFMIVISRRNKKEDEIIELE
jgi:hypothetical protein